MGPQRPVSPDRCRRTHKDNTYEVRDLPWIDPNRRAPSKTLRPARSKVDPSQNTITSSPSEHRAHIGASPIIWPYLGGSSAHARGRARSNLGLPRSMLAPDHTSARARAATPAPARGGAGRCRKSGQVQAHRKGRSPCGKGAPVDRPESTSILQGPAGQRGVARSDRSGHARRLREHTGAP